MKVGVLTFHHTSNYGAALQAVGLASCLRELGHDAGVVDYRPWRVHVRSRSYRWLPAFWRRARRHYPWRVAVRLCIQEAGDRARRLRRVNQFVLSSAPAATPPFYTRRSLRRRQHDFDVIVAGSDEVWKVSRKGGFDPSYWLDFLQPPVRALSYGASVGETGDFAGKRAAIRRWLSRFDGISVRDPHTHELLRDLGIDSTQVVDPGFLFRTLDFRKPPAVARPYAVVCGISADRHAGAVRDFCRGRGWRLYSVGQRLLEADESIADPDPAEWLGFIAAAEFVFTSLFHGVVFALRLHRPFYAFCPRGKRRKLTALLAPLDLSGRMHVGDTTPDLGDIARLPTIDFDSVDAFFARHSAASRDWLTDALATRRQH